jgi:hypothetical protein
MFDFYKDDDDPDCQLYLPAGAAVPAEAAGRRWSFQRQVIDPGAHQRKRIEEQGYFMCKVHPDMVGWDEL